MWVGSSVATATRHKKIKTLQEGTARGVVGMGEGSVRKLNQAGESGKSLGYEHMGMAYADSSTPS